MLRSAFLSNGAPQGSGGSLTTRLAARLVAVMALGAVVVGLAAYIYGSRAARQSYDRLLIGAADQIAESISIRDGEVAVDLPVSAFQLLALAPDDRITYAVLAPDDHVITGDVSLAPLPDGQTFGTGTFGDERIRQVQVLRRMTEPGWVGVVRVEVGQTTRARDKLASEIIRSALGVTAIVGFAICLMAALAVRSALDPLRRVETALAERKARDLTPLDLDVPREIGRLVETLNGFIGRLDHQFGVMRNLIADTSHQLRTPIAALRVQRASAPDGSAS